MYQAQIETRMAQLKEELTKANDELGKLKPRVQFLEQIMLRVDGALTVLQELLDGPDESLPPAIPSGTDSRPKPDAEFAPSWQTVAP